MINILEIYNYGSTVYVWYMWITIIIIILALTALISKITKHWGIFAIPAGILVPVLIICIIGSFNTENSGGFDLDDRKEISSLGFLSYNKHNGSYENGDLHLFANYDPNIGRTYKFIDKCSGECNLDNHSAILKVLINKKIDLKFINYYLMSYTLNTNNDANIKFNVNEKGVTISYDRETNTIEYNVDYRERFYDKDEKEPVIRDDEVTIVHFDDYDSTLDELIIQDIFNEEIDNFEVTTVNDTYTYKRK